MGKGESHLLINPIPKRVQAAEGSRVQKILRIFYFTKVRILVSLGLLGFLLTLDP